MATKVVKTVKVDEVFIDFERNVRQSWKYRVEPKKNFDETKDAPGFYEDILLRGVQVAPEVSELTEDQKDRIVARLEAAHESDPTVVVTRPKYRVIRGHRRMLALQLIRKNHPELKQFAEQGCLVYKGLSEAEEIQLLCDHGGTEPLNDYEEYLSVKRLFGTSLSQEAIAMQLGKTRNWVQDRIHILQLPGVVEENYAKKDTPKEDGSKPVKGKDYVGFTHADVDKMFKAFKADQDAGIDVESDASAFKVIWDQLVNSTNPGDPKKKTVSKATLDERSGLVRGREALEEVIKFVGNEGGNLQVAAEMYDALKAKAGKATFFENENTILKGEVVELKARIAALEEENAALVAHLDSLTVPSNGTD